MVLLLSSHDPLLKRTTFVEKGGMVPLGLFITGYQVVGQDLKVNSCYYSIVFLKIC